MEAAMSFFPDMGPVSLVAAGEHVRAIAWLHPDHPYITGAVPTAFLTRLKEFIGRPSRAGDDFCFPGFGGLHTCEFCARAHGAGNFGLPSGDLLFIFPDMIVHYIEVHGYKPPDQFIEALMRSPMRDSEEFEVLSEPFWHLHKQAQEKLSGVHSL
jgi:hypothetical protein